MKSLSRLVIASILFQIAESLSLPQEQPQPQPQPQQVHHQQQQNGRPRVVGLPIHRSKKTLYYFNASLGTPPQHVRLHLDTGSSDMWVNTPASHLCAQTLRFCSESGTYSANSSATYQYIGSSFNISYADGSGSTGDYATDILRFSGESLSGFEFGIGYKSTSPENVLGIGYPLDEAQVKQAGRNQPYQNLPAKLHADGLISSNSFSLWLNDVDAADGNILFGGLDTGRFRGDLIRVPIEKINDAHTQFFITMTGLDIGDAEVASNTALAVLLDSGTSLTYLPNDMTAKIYRLLNVAYSESQDAAVVPCSLRNDNATMTFRFSSPAAITVSLSEMILDLEASSGVPVVLEDNVPACIFGILPAMDHPSILGDTFLRGAYTVFDLDRNEIALANVNFNVTGSRVVEILSGSSNTVPFSTPASNPIAATQGLPQQGSPTDGLPESESDASASAYERSLKSGFVALFAFATALTLLLVV
ncbi:hypothetical protein E4U43_007743 [Claviceps pusilla]|uniref:Probable aspartic-type endopeptidase OPSB n=1 Tax=Claviceps pusilla TaxID=123648 RepID=A0A9P7SYV5_9HYPO|nr:hypothetical protein E4U43_007743 [Claviceps pusilla]